MKRRFWRIFPIFCAAMILSALAACTPKGTDKNQDVPFKGVKLSDYITLGAYKDFDVDFTESVSDAEASQEAKNIFQQNGYDLFKPDKKKTVLKAGDAVEFDYEGSFEGASESALTGMKGDKHHMDDVGGGSFIPGFEEQMIGQKVGKPFEVKVTFPEDYGKDEASGSELNGKEAVFKCLIHAIGTFSITDEDVKGLTSDQISTVGDLLTYVKDNKLRGDNVEEAYDAAFANATIIKLPQSEVDTYLARVQAQADKNAQSLEDYILSTGSADVAQYTEDTIRPDLEQDLFVYAVAEKESLALTDEDYDNAISYYTQYYGAADADAVYEGFGGKSFLERSIMRDKVKEFILSHAANAPAWYTESKQGN